MISNMLELGDIKLQELKEHTFISPITGKAYADHEATSSQKHIPKNLLIH